MFKFEFEEKDTTGPTFGDVEDDQFFVCDEGYLWQKVNLDSANTIADSEGNPYAGRNDIAFDPPTPIREILPLVKRIVWKE